MLLHPSPSPAGLGLSKDQVRSCTAEVVRDTLPPREATSLLELLQRAATTSAGITFYKTSGSTAESAEWFSYQQLLNQACHDAHWLQTSVSNLQRDTVFLLHFDTHEENIRWFWACTVAGYLPCIVPKFAVSTDRRIAQAEHILRLLDGPVVLTNGRMACAFQGIDTPRLYRVDQHTAMTTRLATTAAATPLPVDRNQRADDLGALMLTSGSTGFSKAVCLRQPQMLAAAAGKAAHCGATSQDVFLSWIALDHVVNLVEMHLHAMRLGAEQIQVATELVVAEPRRFLNLVDRHRVSLSFAPNFFLALLCERVCHPTPEQEAQPAASWDLSCLRCVFSGGEATVRQMAVQLLRALRPYGARPFIRAGYGLTESCAGMVWDLVDHTLEGLHDAAGEFMCCGLPIPGVEMRVLRESDESEAAAGEEGMLQLRGAVLFDRYYCDAAATRAAFTSDGWFITGDNAYLDAHGQLYITGRTKDTLLLNGLTIFAVEVEHSLEQARIPGLTPSFTLVFAHRPPGALTESYCVVYLPSYSPDDAAARVATTEAIERIASLVVHVKPAAVLPLPRSYFEKTSLGKLSRAHFRRLFESGALDSEREAHESSIHAHRQAHRQAPSSPIEQTILTLICARLHAADPDSVSVTTNLFSLGLSSLDFYTVTQDLHQTFGVVFTLPDLLMDPTVAGLARRLASKQHQQQPSPNSHSHSLPLSPSPKPDNRTDYDPVVPLQLTGPKTPLWLVHPASGNVLIFANLARAFHDRPIYAFRSRGVQPGEPLFTSIAEMASTYAAAMQRTQPAGPYALAGYSLGSSIAFEIAKRLESAGQEVRFLGALDGPPDIAPLVGQLTWTEALVMIAYFYELISEPRCVALMPQLRDAERERALDVVLREADPSRVKALRLDRAELSHVTDVTAGFSRAAGQYTPAGSVAGAPVDVFAVDPLLTVTEDRTVWVERYLGQWRALSRRGMAVHQCEGRHADMLGARYVNGLQLVLRRVLEERGV
ncbi:acyl-CoA synthetases /AMP-acid ligases II [Aspergillus japonicus CBS 114.51]|uniref:Acyl-CoA synthetases /AMP-acid ligases II n=1 Tax=Aspergillus japonicus CBS 114.51 TaxID=1448312 RepID=A0A8T8XHY0_ASPJA|nr:acyl-CoA synthetases /AMP-acid ligases II [Aspergillus japonicus CBS 114.51]RAH87434.1 acyl-CoA synthetases /AMP-acid ligases II [Aspergillus japonicus CBS 114.51]